MDKSTVVSSLSSNRYSKLTLVNIIGLKGRGMVVSVFYDPGGSDKETLDRLQHGHFGAFLVTRRQ